MRNKTLYLFLGFLVIASMIGCNLKSGSTKNLNELVYDTSRIAIIPYDSTLKYFFDSLSTETPLTQKDLFTIDSLFAIGIAEYNSSLSENEILVGYHKIDFSVQSYKKQLVAAITRKGEREVWINCFCSVSHPRWKTEVIIVKDGGNCYLNFKINLSTKKHSSLDVNFTV